jgi:hypothetical protein
MNILLIQRLGRIVGLIKSPYNISKKINTLLVWNTTMKLNELSQTYTAKRALKEHFQMPFNLDRMTITESRAMLQRVRSLMAETRKSPAFYRSQNDPAYLKLVFMEQALAKYFSELKAKPTRIVVENEEVEKSQVVLAAQDMVDSVQKMLEQVSDMLVKEMPALIDSVQSEIGVNEAEQFSSQTTEALGSLTAALTQTKTSLQSALNVITGQDMGMGAGGDADAAFGGDEMGGDDMGMGDEMGGDDMGMGDEMGGDDMEEPEVAPVAGVGRARR